MTVCGGGGSREQHDNVCKRNTKHEDRQILSDDHLCAEDTRRERICCRSTTGGPECSSGVEGHNHFPTCTTSTSRPTTSTRSTTKHLARSGTRTPHKNNSEPKMSRSEPAALPSSSTSRPLLTHLLQCRRSARSSKQHQKEPSSGSLMNRDCLPLHLQSNRRSSHRASKTFTSSRKTNLLFYVLSSVVFSPDPVVVADLPVHCLSTDVAGESGVGKKWIFEFGAPTQSPWVQGTSGFTDICGHQRPDAVHGQPPRQLPGELDLKVEVILKPEPDWSLEIVGNITEGDYGGNLVSYLKESSTTSTNAALLQQMRSSLKTTLLQRAKGRGASAKSSTSTASTNSMTDQERAAAHFMGPKDWTMLYDEGFEVELGKLRLLAFSAFDFVNGKNQSRCGMTEVGWYRTIEEDVSSSDFRVGCWIGYQEDASREPLADNSSSIMELHHNYKGYSLAEQGSKSLDSYFKEAAFLQEPVTTRHDHQVVADQINAANLGWTAKVYDQFVGKTARELNFMAGRKNSKRMSAHVMMNPNYGRNDYSGGSGGMSYSYMGQDEGLSLPSANHRSISLNAVDDVNPFAVKVKGEKQQHKKNKLVLLQRDRKAVHSASTGTQKHVDDEDEDDWDSEDAETDADREEELSRASVTLSRGRHHDLLYAGEEEDAFDEEEMDIGEKEDVDSRGEEEDNSAEDNSAEDNSAEENLQKRLRKRKNSRSKRPLVKNFYKSKRNYFRNKHTSNSKVASSSKYRSMTAEQKKKFVLPAEFDWRNPADGGSPYVLPEGINQGDCGSCYVISTIMSLNSRLRVQRLRQLREQGATQAAIDDALQNTTKFSYHYALGCSETNQGCQGGYAHLIGQWSRIYGLAPDHPDCTPQGGWQADTCMGVPQSCPAELLTYRTTNVRYVGGRYQYSNEHTIMQELIQNGPVVLGFAPDNAFMYYSSGIYGANQPVDSVFHSLGPDWERVDHAVLLVGWGVDQTTGNKYWTLQNSWGDSLGSGWGDDDIYLRDENDQPLRKGFFRIKRGSNILGIESIAETADVEQLSEDQAAARIKFLRSS
ncbi:unnamed protein product [Amoebophrya sp. A25]|nr:unnamed protein product [Amoebophrya sp. A25]|eukprot:GSA25T00017719001.1